MDVTQTKTLQWICQKNKKLSSLSLDGFDCNELMSFIKEKVKTGEVNKSTCEHWGEMILYAWKIAPDANEGDVADRESVTKPKLEADVIQDLFYFSIIYPKKYAQRFSWIVDAFVPKLTKKRFNFMFFRCLLPILWRNLESVNEDVRLSAAHILLKFYPLRAEDDVVNAEYLQKQIVAMCDLLMDECVPIRVEAIKKVLLHLRLHWSSFPRYMIKIYLSKITDELSVDKVDEVRVAVYEGMAHLIYCPQARVAVQQALQILGGRGINDRSVSVRLAALKLFNSLINHRHYDCFTFVAMDDLLRRLDFEHSEAVQRQIVRLIFKTYCPTNVESLDNRFVRIARMCKVSRNASLNFHRHIYSLKLISCELAKQHILGLIYGVKMRLGKDNRTSRYGDLSELEGSLNRTMDFTLNSTLNGTTVDGQQREDNKLSIAKDVLDSAIVLWTTMRCDLYQKYPEENERFQKMMENILDRLKGSLDTLFVDSAMVIASNLPARRISRSLQDRVISAVFKGNIDAIHLSGYIEAFSSWDSDRLAELIIAGLDKLYKALACDANGVPLRVNMPAPRANNYPARDVTSSTSDRDSPPLKRVRKGKRGQKAAKADEVPVDYPLKVLNLALSSPVALANIRGKDDFHLVQFVKTLKTIREAFSIRLMLNDFKNAEEIDLMVRCFEMLTLLSIISKPSEEDTCLNDSDDDETSGLEITFTAAAEPMDVSEESTLIEPRNTNAKQQFKLCDQRTLAELKWLRALMAEIHLPAQVIKMFLRCLNLHLDCFELSLRVLKRSTDLLIEIFQTYDVELVGEEMRECTKHLLDALQYCVDDDQLLIKDLRNRLEGLLNYAPHDNEDLNEEEDSRI